MEAIRAVKLEDWIKIATMAGGLAAFVFAVMQYRSAEAWKRVEFVSRAVQSMKQDHYVINVAVMLDWATRKVRLYPEREDAAEQYVEVSQAILARALRKYSDADPFDELEARIRDNFDGFLDYLERFEQFVKRGLVKSETFRPLLQYWVTLIAKPPPELIDDGQSVLWRYINEYEFVEARRLLVALGVEIPEPGEKA